ncbi:Zn-dependent alcohol dehydrogenase [Endozoicomonas sp. OPT23]|uniref:zinc-dependent alcohol dehydrogenase n=1 Tax=Endozoicomonas sp. OPT23 TaxID=2072845 RepID=UPI00129ABA74|nr:alcohol dehydrogenase catalytic domain-containing protein [Endozoicomonas sp. OPT23]MRI34465.1 Zn-dependent alcohol dehydrogenase [Endozoicomonas sp. OPT23]
MKAVRCCDKHIQVQEVARPAGDGVRVKVVSSGICGSDLHLINSGFTPPVTLGHEVAGILPDGRAVAIEPLAPCGHCDQCTTGNYHYCRLGGGMIHGVFREGGMAEEILVPERSIVTLPNNVSASDACLVEPLAVAMHGVRMLDLQPQSRVAVIGAGSVGLAVTAILTSHLQDVALTARHDAQKQAGERLGAKLECAGEYDVAVDCAGTSDSLAQTATLCKPGGIVLMLATYWDGVQLPTREMGMKNLRFYTSSLYGQQGLVKDVEVAAQLLANRPELPEILITHRLPLEAAVEAFAIAGDRKAGAIKVVLEP